MRAFYYGLYHIILYLSSPIFKFNKKIFIPDFYFPAKDYIICLTYNTIQFQRLAGFAIIKHARHFVVFLPVVLTIKKFPFITAVILYGNDILDTVILHIYHTAHHIERINNVSGFVCSTLRWIYIETTGVTSTILIFKFNHKKQKPESFYTFEPLLILVKLTDTTQTAKSRLYANRSKFATIGSVNI